MNDSCQILLHNRVIRQRSLREGFDRDSLTDLPIAVAILPSRRGSPVRVIRALIWSFQTSDIASTGASTGRTAPLVMALVTAETITSSSTATRRLSQIVSPVLTQRVTSDLLGR